MKTPVTNAAAGRTELTAVRSVDALGVTRARGAAGCVTDGFVRDILEIRHSSPRFSNLSR